MIVASVGVHYIIFWNILLIFTRVYTWRKYHNSDTTKTRNWQQRFQILAGWARPSEVVRWLLTTCGGAPPALRRLNTAENHVTHYTEYRPKLFIALKFLVTFAASAIIRSKRMLCFSLHMTQILMGPEPKTVRSTSHILNSLTLLSRSGGRTYYTSISVRSTARRSRSRGSSIWRLAQWRCSSHHEPARGEEGGSSRQREWRV